MALSKLIKEEQAVYGQISDEEWEVIRPAKNERRDRVLVHMFSSLKETSKCDNCSNWKVEGADVWGNSYDTRATGKV